MMKIKKPLLALMASLLLFRGAAAAVSDDETTASMWESIDSLRANAQYSDALAQARKLLEKLPSDTCSYAYELDDARRLIATLETISDMPAEAGVELGSAVRLAADCARLVESGDYEGAARSAERQAEILKRRLGERHVEYASALAALAFFRNMLGELDRAEQLYLSALDIQRASLGNHPDVANTLNNLAALNLDRNDVSAAERLFREAIEVLGESVGEMHPDVALAYYNLAVLCKGKRDFASTEAFCRRALVIYRSLDNRACARGRYAADIAASLRMLGALYAARGNLSRAESLLREAERILRALEDRVELALTLMDLAGIRQDREFFGTAEKLYQQALAQLQESAAGGDEASAELTHYRALALNNLGDLAHDSGNYGAADSLYEQALRAGRQVLADSHQEIALIQLNRARNYRDWGYYDKALPLYGEAAGVLRQRLGATHPYLSQALYSMGNLQFARGNYAQAESLFCEAASIYERSRVRIGSGLDRVTFQNSPYPKLAATYAGLGRTEKCWPTLERYLGRYLADLLAITNSRDLTETETAIQDSLAKEIRDIEEALHAIQDDPSNSSAPAAKEEIEEIRTRLQITEADLASHEQAMASKYPVSEGKPFALERVQASIPDASAMIGWLDVEEKKGVCDSWVYVIKRKGPVSWRRISPAAAGREGCAARRAEEFRNELSERQSMFLDRLIEAARTVWLDRLAPVERLLEGINHLIIIPSGAMLGIPVEALIDTTGTMIVDRFAVSYAPSGTVHAWLAEEAAHRTAWRSNGVLLCGDPPFSGPSTADSSVTRGEFEIPERWPALPGTREEVTEISRIAPRPMILLGADASEQRLHSLAQADTLRHFRAIHFATHAWIDQQRPERSVLVLSQIDLPDPLDCALHGRKIFDGFITTEEILRNWKLDADLVTLSACETGIGTAVPGEGYIGFSHAFFRAGARSIIVSLWKADDKATSLLMRQFYANYFGREVETGRPRRAMSKADALRTAKQWLRNYRDESGKRPFENPSYWANFILVGDHGKLGSH